MGYACVTSTANMFRGLVKFGGQYIYPNNKNDIEYSEICSNHFDKTIKSFLIKISLMYFSLYGSMIGPAYAYIKYGTKTTMTNVQIPFVDRNSNTEFFGNLILASIIGGHGFIGYIGLEVAMSIFSDAVTIMPKLVELEFQRMDDKIEKQQLSDYKLYLTLKNLIRQTLDSDECVSDFSLINFHDLHDNKILCVF